MDANAADTAKGEDDFAIRSFEAGDDIPGATDTFRLRDRTFGGADAVDRARQVV